MEATANHETIGNWIDQSRRGDRDAFACLVRQYQGMVSGVALSRTGDVHPSEDLAQETFLLAWQKLAELEDAAKFPGWICSIARNLARNAVRKKSESEQTGTPLETESTSADPILAFLRGGLYLITNPQWPVTIFAILVLMVGGSLILATISATVPTFRWFVNLGGFGLLFACSVYCFSQAEKANGIERSLPDFFTTPQAWPFVIGIVLLDWIIAFGTVLALICGAFYLRRKWMNVERPQRRLLSRKGFAIVFGTGIVLMLLAMPWCYQWAPLEIAHES